MNLHKLKRIECMESRSFLWTFLLMAPFFSFVVLASDPGLPSSYTELIQYTIPSPDQGKSGSCLYMASTGAMEILLNKSLGLQSPPINGNTDLAELNSSYVGGRMGE